jgi:hypothetical protein
LCRVHIRDCVTRDFNRLSEAAVGMPNAASTTSPF